VHARAVGQPRVDHRRGFVDSPADARHDAVDDAHQMLIVAEAHGGLVDFAIALDPDAARPVDQDVGDIVVLEKRPLIAEFFRACRTYAANYAARGSKKRVFWAVKSPGF